MKRTFCAWCFAPIKVRDTFDERKDVAVCGIGCRDAEVIFSLWQSDEAINRQTHYAALTGGRHVVKTVKGKAR